MRPTALAAALLLAAAPLATSPAWAADPAQDRVEAFNDALLGAMKAGKAAGVQGRAKKLQPAVDAAFDIPLMTRVAVGADWAKIPADDQAKLVRAFERVAALNWAKNFDAYEGEKFQVGGVDSRGPDKLVRNQIVPKKGAPTNLNFRLRQNAGGEWKIVDVFYNGSISSIATQRSDFAPALKAGGASALLKKLDDQADRLAKGG